MTRSIPFLHVHRGLVLLLGFGLGACVSPTIGGGPSADDRLEAVLSAPRGHSREDLARELRGLSLDHPRHNPTLVADAAVSIETGRKGRAMALLDQVLVSEPDHVDAVLLWTGVAARDGDLSGAHRRVRAALGTRPDAPELHEAEALLFYLEDRHPEALRALDRGDALRGSVSWRNAYHRGLIDEARGELAAAEGHYALCLELDPTYEPATRRLRWLAAQRGVVAR